MESRMFPRRNIREINCLLYVNEIDQPVVRNVLNVSIGGMLIEKNGEEPQDITVGNLLKLTIISEDVDIITLEGRIIREQERSFAIKFSLLNKEEEKILKALCV